MSESSDAQSNAQQGNSKRVSGRTIRGDKNTLQVAINRAAEEGVISKTYYAAAQTSLDRLTRLARQNGGAQ